MEIKALCIACNFDQEHLAYLHTIYILGSIALKNQAFHEYWNACVLVLDE